MRHGVGLSSSGARNDARVLHLSGPTSQLVAEVEGHAETSGSERVSLQRSR